MTYSVLSQPVIPVLSINGEEKKIGIRDAFLEAHVIKDISGSNPLERYALLRLLIAFAMDMLHPKTGYDRADILQTGRFSDQAFDAYVSECEKNGSRFDLFDSDHPFLQSKYEEKMDAKALKSVAEIVHALPNGNNHVFVDHRLANSHNISISAAFAALCASYVFCVSGLAGPSSVNNTPPLYAVMIGKNLFETIVINMLSQEEAAPLPYGMGDVAWRKNRKIIPKEMVPAITLLEGLTWMPRRITLANTEDSQYIRNVYCQAGLDFRGNDLWNDPHVPRFRKKDGSFGTVKPELSRAIWRDAGTLLYDHDSRQIRQPLAIRCLPNIYDEDEIPDWIRIRVAGLITNQAAYIGWSEGEIDIPTLLLRDQEMADTLREDISMIEKVQSCIYTCVQRYFDKPRNSSKTEEHEIAAQCQQHFLKASHDLIFGETITDICAGISPQGHNKKFCDSVKALIKETISQILYAAGNNSESIIKQIEAEKWIWYNYQKITTERNDKYGGS